MKSPPDKEEGAVVADAARTLASNDANDEAAVDELPLEETAVVEDVADDVVAEEAAAEVDVAEDVVEDEDVVGDAAPIGSFPL